MKRLSLHSFIALVLILTVLSSANAQSSPEPTEFPADTVLMGDIVIPNAWLSQRSTFYATLWTDGIVPYSFAADVTQTNRDRMIDAMREWEAAAGIDFVERTIETNYIEIINATGNWSYVGMIGGKQQLGIVSWSWKYILVHELGHTLGYWHEQSRPDRDQYIQVQWENIDASKTYNFATISAADTFGPYDFDSVMHYDQYAFSNNGKRTLLVNAAYSTWQNSIGQRTHLSELDKAGMAALYPKAVAARTPLELVTNAGFETAAGIEGYGWKGVSLVKDKRVCKAAYSEACAFKFSANAGINSTITQSISAPVSAGGDTLILSAAFRANLLTAKGLVKAVITYTDGTTASLKFAIPTGTYAYRTQSRMVELTGAVQTVRVMVKSSGGSGAFMIDNVSLMLTPADVTESSDRWIALPDIVQP